MRIIGILLIALSSLPAFAADIVCERQTTPTRTEYALIDTWPDMVAHTYVKNCVGDNVQFCFENRQDTIIDRNEICGYRVNTQWECRSRQRYVGRTQIIETECPRSRISARLQIDSRGRGRYTCMRGNRVEHTWNLGECY